VGECPDEANRLMAKTKMPPPLTSVFDIDKLSQAMLNEETSFRESLQFLDYQERLFRELQRYRDSVATVERQSRKGSRVGTRDVDVLTQEISALIWRMQDSDSLLLEAIGRRLNERRNKQADDQRLAASMAALDGSDDGGSHASESDTAD